MIRFPGLDFDFCVASGALAFDGRGWLWDFPFRWLGALDPHEFVVVAKTVTDQPRVGNLSWFHPWTCVRRLKGRSAVNAVGLTNPGIDYWLRKQLPRARKKGYKIAPSVWPENPEQAGRMACLLSTQHFPFVEVNLSCPNVEHVPADIPEMLSRLRNSGHPIVLKLAIGQVQPDFIRVVDEYVDAYHAINTIPWDQMFPGKSSPIERYTHRQKGGVSGRVIHHRATDAVWRLDRLTEKPIIGGGGIVSIHEVENFELAGADAFSIGTLFLYQPWKPNQIVRQYRDIQSRTVRHAWGTSIQAN